jgi:hypothetical protein
MTWFAAQSAIVLGGILEDQLFGELPPDSVPPPVPAEPAARDVCVGADGVDTAVDCDIVASVEG